MAHENQLLVASLAEWNARGVTRGRLRTLVRSGELVKAWPGVYATRSAIQWGQNSPARQHALLASAARASVGRDSVASHQSAALIHGLALYPAPPALVTLTRTRARRSGRQPAAGVTFHTAALPEAHVTRSFGVQVTTVARTVVDIARTASFMSAVVTGDAALRAGLTTRAGMLSVCSACAGWPGVRQARRVVEFSQPGAESVLESCARVIFDEHGLESAELQASIAGPAFRYSVDFFWPAYRVIAEADGEVKYADPRRAIHQLSRDQQLRDHGYKVVHFTWRELHQTPETVVTRIRHAFGSPPPSDPPPAISYRLSSAS